MASPNAASVALPVRLRRLCTTEQARDTPDDDAPPVEKSAENRNTKKRNATSGAVTLSFHWRRKPSSHAAQPCRCQPRPVRPCAASAGDGRSGPPCSGNHCRTCRRHIQLQRRRLVFDNDFRHSADDHTPCRSEHRAGQQVQTTAKFLSADEPLNCATCCGWASAGTTRIRCMCRCPAPQSGAQAHRRPAGIVDAGSAHIVIVSAWNRHCPSRITARTPAAAPVPIRLLAQLRAAQEVAAYKHKPSPASKDLPRMKVRDCVTKRVFIRLPEVRARAGQVRKRFLTFIRLPASAEFA